MVPTYQSLFYEVIWRHRGEGRPFPFPWWAQQYFRHWAAPYPGADSFARNDFYRYWNMVGVKDHHQECLVGQAGEVEPVRDPYTLTFFLFDPATKELHFPQLATSGGAVTPLEQGLEDGYLPVVHTTYRAPVGVNVEEKVIGVPVGLRQRSVGLVRLTAALAPGTASAAAWLCLGVLPTGPTGFENVMKTGDFVRDRRIGFLRYLPDELRVEVNTAMGPVFAGAPPHFGVYGNDLSVNDPEHYLQNSPFNDLASGGALSGRATATDPLGGLCMGVFAWPFRLDAAAPTFSLDVKLPIDDYRDNADLADVRDAAPDTLESANRAYWTGKLDGSGLQAALPGAAKPLFDLFRTCRANLLMLSDNGEIHPGPTIYDSFWVRDSSVEGIACALCGDLNLPKVQFGQHYPTVFNQSGFFGGQHEKDSSEWDSNGEALWAFGRFDRILGPAEAFGARLFSPYVLEGARWFRPSNRGPYGLLPSGWSAEHLGDANKPHYWDDLWGLAGLYEAARLAERLHSPNAAEIWGLFDDLKKATADSIRWALDQQRGRGFWETFVPTGPADVGKFDSSMIGIVAYFHPCRLYVGPKLGDDIDRDARLTLETVWAHFIEGGFRHDSAWRCYGTYLTLQLAHAFLLLGNLDRMEQLLNWAAGDAAFPRVGREGDPASKWQVVSGAWNEQHCYPVATDFARVPFDSWYMGDIPHGWACAELILLIRDVLFFEAAEDDDPHIYLAPGVLPKWLGDGASVKVSDAPTVFGALFGYEMNHNAAARTLEIAIRQRPPANVRFVFPCRFGSGVSAATADGNPVPLSGTDVRLPAGTSRAVITYS